MSAEVRRSQWKDVLFKVGTTATIFLVACSGGESNANNPPTPTPTQKTHRITVTEGILPAKIIHLEGKLFVLEAVAILPLNSPRVFPEAMEWMAEKGCKIVDFTIVGNVDKVIVKNPNECIEFLGIK